MLLFLTVFGMSVEDLSEIGGAFLGVDKLMFHGQPVVGDTVTARSEVVAMRESRQRPNQGIVTWRTVGYDQNGEVVVQFERTNLISKRGEVA
jgi:acyl dehydratase